LTGSLHLVSSDRGPPSPRRPQSGVVAVRGWEKPCGACHGMSPWPHRPPVSGHMRTQWEAPRSLPQTRSRNRGRGFGFPLFRLLLLVIQGPSVFFSAPLIAHFQTICLDFVWIQRRVIYGFFLFVLSVLLLPFFSPLDWVNVFYHCSTSLIGLYDEPTKR
jgi:hypothetical protein